MAVPGVHESILRRLCGRRQNAEDGSPSRPESSQIDYSRQLPSPGVPPQPHDGPATSHVGRTVYRIPHVRVELQDRATSTGKTFRRQRPVVIVLERGELPEDRTKVGELRLSDRQELSAWWTGFRFEL